MVGAVELLEDRKGGRRRNRVMSLEENTRWRRRKERWLERESIRLVRRARRRVDRRTYIKFRSKDSTIMKLG